MTDQELYNKMEQEFNEYKDKKLKNIKNCDFYGIALRYELLEWVGSSLLENDGRQEEIEVLKGKNSPLEYLYDMWLGTDDELWNTFDYMLHDTIQWEKSHGTN